MYQGGALRLALLAAGAALRVNPPPAGTAPPKDFSLIHEHLPLSTLDEAIGWQMPWLQGIIAHNRVDGFWQRTEITPELGNLELAVQNIVGYYDLSCNETIDNFQKLPNHGKKQLILGPWDHGTIGKQIVAGVDFGPQAKLDTDTENLSWFDRFLKPAKGASEFSPVRYFVMGENSWRTSTQWPPADAVPTAFYLHSGGEANTRTGNGRLTWQQPDKEPADVFESDPYRPVPSEPAAAPAPSRGTPWRPVDRASIEDRRDVLVYTAAAQKTPLSIAGHVFADLWISVDAPDADWALKLIDVAPDGAAGVGRGHYVRRPRSSTLSGATGTGPALSSPGRSGFDGRDYSCGPCAAHRNRRQRVSHVRSQSPHRKGPTGYRKQVARQTVYHSREFASRLLCRYCIGHNRRLCNAVPEVYVLLMDVHVRLEIAYLDVGIARPP